MKKQLLAAFIIFAGSALQAQTHFAIKSTGVTDAGYNYKNATGITTVIANPNDNVLSAEQTIPFAFNFLGQTYTKYKACDNGYITFDLTETTAQATATTLPSSSAPKSAIFAAWADFKLATGSGIADAMSSWTYGSAPNRVHVIQWLSVTPPSAAGGTYTSIAILLKEKGGFDVIHNQTNTTSLKGTVGVNNADGSNGYAVVGSPNVAITATANDDDYAGMILYRFFEGSQPAAMPIIVKNNTAKAIGTTNAATQDIKIGVSNYGSSAITSATFNYNVDGGNTVAANLTSLNIAANGTNTASLVHTVKYIPFITDIGQFKNITVWLSDINGGSAASDTMTFQVFINKGVSGTKRVLLEEGTGAWCGFCPDGHYRMKTLLDANPDKIVSIVHHNNDGMKTAESDAINTQWQTGYPYGMVDRVKFGDQTTVGINRGLWATKAAERLTESTPVNVSITDKNYNAATRTISFTVKADFVDAPVPGDLRINAVVLEDAVRGAKLSATSTQWNQRNYYSSADAAAGGASHPMYARTAYIVGYYHQHTARKIMDGAWGTSGVIPTSPAVNSSYQKGYTYVLPAENDITDYNESSPKWDDLQNTANGKGWNKHYDIKIAAFISYYNADGNQREVINAIETHLTNASGINENNNASVTNVYPNPTNGITNIDFNLKNQSNVVIEVLNIAGQTVAQVSNDTFTGGQHTASFNANNLPAGVYFVNIKTAEGNAMHKFVVNN